MYKKQLFLLVLLASLTVNLFASIPSGYYNNANNKCGATLKTALYNIITNPSVVGYDNLWTAFQTTDKRSDDKVWDMYSDNTNFVFGTNKCGNYSGEGSCYNREHSVPASWFSDASPMYSDLFHLYPTDGYVNNRRSNYPFGETNGETYSSHNGFSKLGKHTRNDSYKGNTVFEPADEYKGDFARTYFYMVTCYQDRISTWSSDMLDGNTYPGLATWALDMLLEWAQNDPVSDKETARNEAVYAKQGNRNPYIDFPGLEYYVFGAGSTTNVDLNNYVNPYGGSSTTVAAPGITPNGGTYTLNTNVSVSLSCSTSGATIYYTTNGTTPTSSSTQYTGAFIVTSSTAQTKTVNAIAIKDGTSSSVTSANFVFNESGQGGGDGTTYTKVTSTSQLVSGKKYILVNAANNVAAGTTLTTGSSANYLNSTSVTISGDDVTIDNNVAVFTLGISGSNYSFYNSTLGGYLTATAAKKISFSSSQIYVWTASSGSNGYQITHTTSTYGTMYYNSGSPRFTTYTSAQAEADLYVEKSSGTTVNAPSFSPVPSTYTSAQTVTISSTTSGATIRYTTDGTDPSATTGTQLANDGTVTISSTCTLKAVAVLSGTASAVTSGTYTINLPQAATPTFSPAAGSYSEAQNVTISCETDGATIHYTTNGTDPTTSSATYSSAIPVSATTTIKAIAVKSGYTSSEVATATYTINSGGGSSSDEYELITSTDDLESGSKYLLVANNGGTYYAYTGVESNWGTVVTVTPSSNIINLGTDTNGSSVAPLTLGGSTGAWTFYDETNEYYLALTSASNVLNTAANANATTAQWSISTSSDLFQIQNVGTTSSGTNYLLRFNTGNSYLKFRCYKTTTTSDMLNVQLYKQKSSPAPATVAAPTFSPDGGEYTGSVAVTISSATSGAVIYYTTGGSTPTETTGASLTNGQSVVITSGCTIKAIAVYNNESSSVSTSNAYTINAASGGSGEAKYVKITSTDDLTSGEQYLIVYEDGSKAFDGSLETLDVASNNIDVTISNDIIVATSTIDASSFTITESGNYYTIRSASGYYIGRTTNANGLQSDQSTAFTNTIDFNIQGYVNIVASGGAYLRFNNASNDMRFRYYKSSTYGGQKAVYLYKRVEEGSATETISAQISSVGYSTMYYSNKNLVVPNGVTAYTYSINNGTPARSKTYTTDDIIPAGEAVVLYSATPGTYEFVVTSTSATPDSNSDMKGTDTAKTTASGYAKYYKMSLNSSQEAGSIGWYFGATNGGAFLNGAHKAYLAVPSSKALSVMAAGFPFADETTGISTIDNTQPTIDKNAAVYSLDGRRVMNTSALQKGIYIVNGKKVVVK